MTERIRGRRSIHDEAKDIGPHQHVWRVVECNSVSYISVRYIRECSKCGLQREFACDFDDDYA